MKKIAWLTDIHLDHIEHKDSANNIADFCKEVLKKNPDGIVITGDITSAKSINEHFTLMAQSWKDIPVYFVLGNHDFYDGSFSSVEETLINTIENSKNFFYLTKNDVIELTPNTAITGHNGWYDGGYGNWFKMGVVIMQDYFLIQDFKHGFSELNLTHIHQTMQKKAKDCHNHILRVLPKALDQYNKVIFATHVPPFEDACVYNGKKSDWQWMPNFSSKLAGDALFDIARRKEYKDKEIIVLCGHTHGKWKCEPEKNIICHTGYSKYGHPLDSLVLMDIE